MASNTLSRMYHGPSPKSVIFSAEGSKINLVADELRRERDSTDTAPGGLECLPPPFAELLFPPLRGEQPSVVLMWKNSVIARRWASSPRKRISSLTTRVSAPPSFGFYYWFIRSGLDIPLIVDSVDKRVVCWIQFPVGLVDSQIYVR